MTPTIAKELLSRNQGNRKVRNTVVNYYVDQMKRGQWRENTVEVIKIAPNGRVLDGQHLLYAIINSGISLYFHIAFNVPEENFKVLDTGLRRTSGDSLDIMGVPYATAVAGAIKNWFLLKRKESLQRSSTRSRITNDDIIKEYFIREEFCKKRN